MEGLSVEQHAPGNPHEKLVLKEEIAVDFRTGRPDLRQFPQYAWRQLIHEAAQEPSAVLFSFSGPQGLYGLRLEIAAWLSRSRGLSVSPENIFITSGATQALHVLAEMLCGNGGKVIMEDPCHSGMLQTFRNKGCVIEAVPVDDRGKIVDLLPAEDACAIYTTPSHQFPLGGKIGRAHV